MSPEKLSYIAMKFKRMCAKIIQLKKKYDFHVAVGGNGAWELAKTDRMTNNRRPNSEFIN
jgi:hypothetical protein